MRTSRRHLTEAERAAPLSPISIFSRARRRQARLEKAQGEAEIFDFDVARAWNLISCWGPPCCPNTWLLETHCGEFVYLESWTLLRAEEGRFPASHVNAARMPLTHRLVGVSLHGEPIEAPRLPDNDEHLVDDLPECEVVPLARIPPACLRSREEGSEP